MKIHKTEETESENPENYNHYHFNLLKEKYGLTHNLKHRRKSRGLIVKENHENMSLEKVVILTKCLLMQRFIYLEGSIIAGGYDMYQFNVSLDENIELVSDTLIYHQLLRLIFPCCSSFSNPQTPLKYYFEREDYDVILKIISNYFKAVEDVFGLLFLYSSQAFCMCIEAFPILYSIGAKRRELTYNMFFSELSKASKMIDYNEDAFFNNKRNVLNEILGIINDSFHQDA